jgi:hypothetical protein
MNRPETIIKPTGFFKNAVPGIATMGEDRIANSDVIGGQVPERIFRGAPKQWRITNRAERGHVKVWMDSFNGEVYPEDATDDKRTWLQPGQSMVLSLEAGLHFFGNIFMANSTDPAARKMLVEAARTIIERTGGFELETQAANPGKNPELRVIGGPIGLPDFIIAPLDGRERVVGKPVAIYDVYWSLTKGIVKPRRGNEPSVLATERALLEERIREYTLDDVSLYGPDELPIARSDEGEGAASEGDEELPDMASAAQGADEDPTRTRSPRGGRR